MERVELKRWLLAHAPAHQAGDFVFLLDPQAGPAERARLEDHLAQAPAVDASMGWLGIPTGGSSGRVRFARHDELTLSAAVTGFCLHFEMSRIHAVGVLPLHHVSGLMAQVRCAATGGDFLPWNWKRLTAGEFPRLPSRSEGWVISLVPTQLQQLLTSKEGRNFLLNFRLIFIGGGPAWPSLLSDAAEARLPLSFSYGMTETAAMVAAQSSQAFLEGGREAGLPMPHARVQIIADDGGLALPGAAGAVRIEGESVFRGYFPEFRVERSFHPEDLGVLSAGGTLQILGRRDGMIISGGEKVWPAEVEAALRATGAFSDVVVLGIPDTKWGQAVTAFYPAGDQAREKGGETERIEAISRTLGTSLAAFKHPKRWIAVATWPRNEQGKVNRETLLKSVFSG